MQVYILAFVIALFTSWLLTPYVKKLAFRIGALDKPDGRKVHKGIMPRLGGLAIYLGFVVAVLCSMHLSKDVMALLLGGTVILIVGIIDDVYQLPAKVKLLGQIAAAAVLVLFDIRIEWLNNPWGGYFYLEYLSIPFTIFWVISFTNVVNLMDGLDGLAAGVAGIASITVILVAIQQGFYPVAVITAALAGGIVGFMRYNFNPATIFMGDTGSMFIGYMLAAISIFGAVKSAATIALIVPAIALGLPIMDTALLLYVATRMADQFSSRIKDTCHRLLAMGMTPASGLFLLMYIISAIIVLLPVLLTEVGGYYAAIIAKRLLLQP